MLNFKSRSQPLKKKNLLWKSKSKLPKHRGKQKKKKRRRSKVKLMKRISVKSIIANLRLFVSKTEYGFAQLVLSSVNIRGMMCVWRVMLLTN